VARETYFGKAIKRVEDPRFLTGTGLYTDDIQLHGMLHVAMVRSPYAHARIKGIDASAARAHPGVHAVFIGKDLRDAGCGSIPAAWVLPGIKLPPHYAIAVDKVRHVGEIIAAVVADDRATAEDAAALVDVDLESLPATAIG
jgi:carbon-monoxide dehydrogenase large subunit